MQSALWLLLLLALIGGFWRFLPHIPRVIWNADKQTHFVGVSPSARTLVTCQSDVGGPICHRNGPICLWDIDTRKLQFTLAHDWSMINSIELSPDGRFLAALKDHKQLTVWDIATGEELLNRKLNNSIAFQFCPDGKHLVFDSWESTSGDRLLVHLWNIDTKCDDALVPGWIGQTAIAKGGKTLAHWDSNQDRSGFAYVQFWKTGEGTGDATLERQFDLPFAFITFSSDLQTFVTVNRLALSGEGAEIAVWDSVTGRKRSATSWQDPEMELRSWHFSPDDKIVIAHLWGTTGSKVVRWEIYSEIKLLPTHSEWNPECLSPDGKVLLIAQPDGAKLLDAHTLANRGTLRHEGDKPRPIPLSNSRPPLPRFTFSANSELVLVTGLAVDLDAAPSANWFEVRLDAWFSLRTRKRNPFWLGTPVVRLYDVGTATEVTAFEGCSQALFSPDGRFIATLHEDGFIRIWDPVPSNSVARVLAFSLGLWFAAMSGARVLTRGIPKPAKIGFWRKREI